MWRSERWVIRAGRQVWRGITGRIHLREGAAGVRKQVIRQGQVRTGKAREGQSRAEERWERKGKGEEGKGGKERKKQGTDGEI